MRAITKFLSVCLSCVGLSASKVFAIDVHTPHSTPTIRNLFDLKAVDIDGNERSLAEYQGKVVMIVNVASRCGFTGQYEGLEAVYTRYKERGFVILGFPSNDFLSQEPGSNAEIKSFCQSKYQVTFPLFAKGEVTGEEKQPVFKYITEDADPKLAGRVMWNFEKFLFNRRGQLVERYRSMTTPESGSITGKIEELLKETLK